MNTALVAFLDILGFKDKLLNVNDDESLTTLYKEVKAVHKYFEKDPDSEMIQNAHKLAGRTISSLSDAVTVAIDYKSPLLESTPLLDILAVELSDIAISQSQCVCEGIFLRGGIDVGYHYLNDEKDIILSDAMAKAYKLEEEACYPIISFDEEFYKEFIDCLKLKKRHDWLLAINGQVIMK